MDIEAKKQVQNIAGLLGESKYKEIESLTNGIRLSASEIKSAVDQHGETLVRLPEKAFELLDVVEIQNAKFPSWSVALPLWTEGGRSDLTMEVTVIRQGKNYSITLDDIHVL